MGMVFGVSNQEGGWMTGIFNLLVMFVLFFFIFRLQMYQIIARLERVAVEFEVMAEKGKSKVVRKCIKRGAKRKDVKRFVDSFANFFIIPPLDADPYGIMSKIEHLLNTSENRFEEAAKIIMPSKDPEDLADIAMALKGVIGMTQLAKIVRHAVELAKKMKNFQIALIIQMQLPLLKRMAKGQAAGTKAFLDRFPIGDAIGPYVAATYIEKEPKEIAKDIVYKKVSLEGRTAHVVKASGPGARVGKPGTGVETLLKRHKIARVITVDAAGKLEGERTGSVAEGVGVAMGGGANPERVKIEETCLKMGIPIDAVAIKMGIEEAIMPLNGKILGAVPRAQEAVSDSIKRTKKGDSVIIVGVGNGVGVGNTRKSLKDIPSKVKKHDAKVKAEKEKERKKGIGRFIRRKGKEDNGTSISTINTVFYLFQNWISRL